MSKPQKKGKAKGAKGATGASKRKKITTALLMVVALSACAGGGYMTWLMTPPPMPQTAEEAMAMMKSARYRWMSDERKLQYQQRLRELMEGLDQDKRMELVRANFRDRNARREMFEGMKTMAEERAKSFAGATPEERLVMLDQDIDRIVAMREQFQGMRGAFGRGEGQPQRPELSEEEKEKRRAEMKERADQRTQDRAEKANPQTQAVMHEYHTAIKIRMKQRGIEGGLFGPGGRGGGGRGGGKK